MRVAENWQLGRDGSGGGRWSSQSRGGLGGGFGGGFGGGCPGADQRTRAPILSCLQGGSKRVAGHDCFIVSRSVIAALPLSQ